MLWLVIHFINILCNRELLNNLIAQKQQKTFSTEHSQLVELLLQKDSDLKANLKVDQSVKYKQPKTILISFFNSWQKNKGSCSKKWWL